MKLFLSHVELGKRGLSNEEETGLKRIYRPDYRDPIEKQEEPEVNPADIEDDLKRYDSYHPNMRFDLFVSGYKNRIQI